MSDNGERRKRSRWDRGPAEDERPEKKQRTSSSSSWDQENSTTTTTSTPQKTGSKWDQNLEKNSQSKWDQTPVNVGNSMQTPVGGQGLATPMGTPQQQQQGEMTPELYNQLRFAQQVDERNKPLSDEEIDAMLPPTGYEIVAAPAGYVPKRPTSRYQEVLASTPTPLTAQSPAYYQMPSSETQGQAQKYNELIAQSPTLQGITMKPEDVKFFGKMLDGELTQQEEKDSLSSEESRERRIALLLLKVKNGTPPMRRAALRQITEKARELGAGPLFNQILPLLMSSTLDDQERHLLVKVIDRILYKLDDLVRPYVHKILLVISPMLVEEDYYARIEGREIISNLAKAAGLPTMIATMRPDIDNPDDFVRNTTSRAFAVVASALGVPSLLPFLKAVCNSKKSWQARHTGIKIIQQVAILMGCGILPYLKQLVEIIESGLNDEQNKIRIQTALTISALAEASYPYGIESFESVLRPLWIAIHKSRNKALAAFLKAIGFLLPLMSSEVASHFIKHMIDVVIREFSNNEDEMKKVVLKVVKQCVAIDGLEKSFVKEKILPPFFKSFWIRRMAMDKRNYKQLVETTVELANCVGASSMVRNLVDDLKDESEPFRKMVMETIMKIVQNKGVIDIEPRLEEKLIDGCLYTFQELTEDTQVVLQGFGHIMTALGNRAKPYLPQIAGIITHRLGHKSSKVRQHSADLISQIAPAMAKCGEEARLCTFGMILNEYFGEEFPEVLGSIIAAIKNIVYAVGMDKMTPPIKDLLPRLTPILKNRHEKVQEHTIELVGHIANEGSEHVPPREWMRICFDMVEMLKAHRKLIRRAAIKSFGYISKAIGPQDVITTLLNNLKVQERTLRVCTTIAIAIVAETCAPFTVIPAIMTEYRVPELNVQNGVLKSLAFLFEYIGEMGKDYIYAVIPLLEDALTDRDLVHRQTAATVVKNLALGCYGLGCEDGLMHLLNLVWPNIFETSPHVINAIMEAVEGLRVGLGPAIILQYCLQGLFHPARKVRNTYWKIYNNIYIGGQDALIPAFPRLDDEGKNTYARQELDWFL